MAEFATVDCIMKGLNRNSLTMGTRYVEELSKMGFTKKAIAALFKAQGEDLDGTDEKVRPEHGDHDRSDEGHPARPPKDGKKDDEEDEEDMKKSSRNPVAGAVDRQRRTWESAGETPLKKSKGRPVHEDWAEAGAAPRAEDARDALSGRSGRALAKAAAIETTQRNTASVKKSLKRQADEWGS